MKVSVSRDYNANDFQSIRCLEYRITFKNSCWRHTYLTTLDITWLLPWHHVFFQCQNTLGPLLLCKPGILHVTETSQWLFTVITLVLLENFKEMNFGRCGKMITSANGTAWFSKGSSAYEDLEILKQEKKMQTSPLCFHFFSFCFTSSLIPIFVVNLGTFMRHQFFIPKSSKQHVTENSHFGIINSAVTIWTHTFLCPNFR